LASAAGLTASVAGFARRRLTYLALCAAAIFLLAEALMVRFAFGALRELAGEPKVSLSSLLNRSICSLIATARLS
jgi:hypothetical protein